MSDTPPVESPPDSVPSLASDASTPEPQVPPPAAPEPEPSAPEQLVHPWTKRSFGFRYLGTWLEGSSYVVNRLPNGRTQDDASGWYGQIFYESLEQLMNSAAFSADQQKEVLATIQRLVR